MNKATRPRGAILDSGAPGPDANREPLRISSGSGVRMEAELVRISILYDNRALEGLEADWGFSVFIETPKRRILFDAGADGHVLLSNAAAMGVDLSSADTVFVSHNHFDHIGGLSAAIWACPRARIFIPRSLRGVKRGYEVVSVSGEMDIGDGFWSTGELDSLEQSLLVPLESGYMVVVGCSHPGLDEILEAAGRHGIVHTVIGGLHGFDSYDLLKGMDHVCPTHCTAHIDEIRMLFPKKYLPGGAGRKYCFPMETDLLE